MASNIWQHTRMNFLGEVRMGLRFMQGLHCRQGDERA